MFKRSTISIIAVLAVSATISEGRAQQKQVSRVQTQRVRNIVVCDQRGCSDQGSLGRLRHRRVAALVATNEVVADANGNRVVERKPTGCPHAFCGCEASRYVFGEIRPDLNLASNWIRKFPRASAAPGMVAARNHHVMVLMSHADGENWFVHDGNSGGGLTREHVVSIKGFVIVNPHAARTAQTN